MPRHRKSDTPPEKRRAPKGSVEPLALRAEPGLTRAAGRLAREEGVTVAEWWRRAGRERLLRQAHQYGLTEELLTAMLGEG